MAIPTVMMATFAVVACMCRLAQMHISTHRLAPQFGYIGLSFLALGAGLASLLGIALPVAAMTATFVCGYLLVTLPEWQFSPPARTLRATAKEHRHGRDV